MPDPVRKNTEKVAAAVKEVDKSADRSTVLAADRTIFAAERSYAAWVRTGLTSLAAGVFSPGPLQCLLLCCQRVARAIPRSATASP